MPFVGPGAAVSGANGLVGKPAPLVALGPAASSPSLPESDAKGSSASNQSVPLKLNEALLPPPCAADDCPALVAPGVVPEPGIRVCGASQEDVPDPE